MTLRFTKMHGLGNDFIVIDGVLHSVPQEGGRWAPRWCHRHFGIGADGLLFVLPSKVADFRMRLFNADGSEAEMCGNGLRCLAKFVYERGYTHREEFTVETPAGIMRPRLKVEGGKVVSVTVDMGEPRLARRQIPMLGEPAEEPVVGEEVEVEGQSFRMTAVSMGNPHAVLFLPQVEGYAVEHWGPRIERHPLFPQRTNVEFVEVMSPSEVRMRVWERGVGETLACGSGACAAVVAGVLNGLMQPRATVHLPGGDLLIEWREDGRVLMTGPAEEVFQGEVPVPE